MAVIVQRQGVQRLGNRTDDQDPQQVLRNTARTPESDNHAPYIDRKRDPPEDAHLLAVVEQNLSAVIDQHKGQRDQLQKAGRHIPRGNDGTAGGIVMQVIGRGSH